MNLQNKVAIVTGASKGIGKSIAISLAKEGCNVAIIARSELLLEETANEVRSYGVECFAFAGDLKIESHITKFIAGTVEKFGRIDVLVNNAGIGHFKQISELSIEQWDEMFTLNLRSLFLITQASLPHLRKNGEGAVINISSLAGKNAFVGGGGYASTKHALLGFTRCLMLEERKNGIRVLALCPGSVDTYFPGQLRASDDPKKDRILHAQDVADSALLMLKLPQRAMVSEIDIRPSNP